MYPSTFLRSIRAAIDLVSIMVGVIIIGIIASVLGATVFTVIPWTQDEASKQTLASLKTAQGSVRADPATGTKYLTLPELVTAGRLPSTVTAADSTGKPKVGITTSSDGTCYVAVSRSGSGKIWAELSTKPGPYWVTTELTPGCITDAEFKDLLDGLGGIGAPVAPLLPVASITYGGAAAVNALVDGDGQLWTWGSANNTVLGLGSTVPANGTFGTPVANPVTQKFAMVAATNLNSLAVDVNGDLWSWGYGGPMLGTGGSADVNQPTKVPTPQKWKKVWASSGSAVGLDTNGDMWAWGDSSPWGTQTTPRKVTTPGNAKVKDVLDMRLWDQNYVLDENGNLWDWFPRGTSFGGMSSTTPFTAMASGWAQALAIDPAGHLWSWTYSGSNYGDHGNGAAGPTPFPTKITTDATKFVAVAGGKNTSAAIDEDGHLWRWGWGTGFNVPTRAPGNETFKWVAFPIDERNMIAGKTDGSVVVSAGVSQTDDFTLSAAPWMNPTTKQIDGAAQASITAGMGTRSIILPNGQTWVWSPNGVNNGQPSQILGYNYGVPSATAVRYTEIGHGPRGDVAADTAGKLWMWGTGQVGDGTDEQWSVYAPQAVGAAGTFTDVAAGGDYSNVFGALDSTGRIWTWGTSGEYLMANGDASKAIVKTAAPVTGPDYTDIALGRWDGAAIDKNGELWVWGRQAFFNGSYWEDKYVPTQVTSDKDFVKVVVGSGCTFAIDSAQILYSYGSDYNGVGCRGVSSPSGTPTRVGGSTTFQDVAGGVWGGTAVDTAGNLWAWGSSNGNDLGLGATSSTTTPVKITSTSKFLSVAASYYAPYRGAIDTDGNVWEWGTAGYGGASTPTKLPFVPGLGKK